MFRALFVASSLGAWACGDDGVQAEAEASLVAIEDARGCASPMIDYGAPSDVASLTKASALVVVGRVAAYRPTVVNAPLPTYEPKPLPSLARPPDIGPNRASPPEDRWNDPDLQPDDHQTFWYTDTTVIVDAVLVGPPELLGKQIVNRTRGDGLHTCTAGDPPPPPKGSHLFFLVQEPTGAYVTTSGAVYGRYPIGEDGALSATPGNRSGAAVEIAGRSLAEVRAAVVAAK